MSISRHIIDDFHSIFYHLDDDECDEEIPVWRRQAATTLSCRDAKRENSWWVELVRQDTLLGNLFQYEQIFEYFCIQAAVSAVRKDTRCLGKARIHCSRIIWDPGKYAVRENTNNTFHAPWVGIDCAGNLCKSASQRFERYYQDHCLCWSLSWFFLIWAFYVLFWHTYKFFAGFFRLFQVLSTLQCIWPCIVQWASVGIIFNQLWTLSKQLIMTKL